ncbi:hypothetical protein Ptr86124_003431 [Pyrenophora tritici-repentis]|uniref:Uncharacterized protein n=1 Tax=Pyrenophora tritici-repentis TaxID=45151 RepID=A0A922NLY6_9PLEO|nr:hypothetical protein Ptr86124_003431 [Pyrenophora tritici-repentis]
MDSERPHQSITLPRNFQFHYRDDPAPQTPEPEPQPEQLQPPPPPPRQVLKVRRRRTTMVMNPDDMDAIMDQRPIPTIEAPEIVSEPSSELPSYSLPQDDAFLSPGFGYTRMLPPPKTPVAQMRTIDHYDGHQDWSDIPHVSQSESSSRPTSSSGFSDSSISSCDSIGSFLSRGGSCTSPEEESFDPFFGPSTSKAQRPTSPSMSFQPQRTAKKIKSRATFTEEMDYHLWMTYMKYLQDPTVTPFKALPSTAPPNGACHRVARMARKTWKDPKPARAGASRASARYAAHVLTPATTSPIQGSSSASTRPNKSYMRFPTEKQCRKRLRDLAKSKPTLSAHYQRLLRRSPSPLQSSPPPEDPPQQQSQCQPVQQPLPQQQSLSSPFGQGSASFSTRDMNVSLATSTAPSMQMGNPLSQLASGVTPRPPARTWSSARSSAHQKSQSLHINLGLGNVLGSPFHAKPEASNVSTNQRNVRTWHAPASTSQSPRLGSPFQLHAPRPKSRVFKRRALHNNSFEGSRINELFGAPAESSHRRVRSRGFSLGDMMEGARRLPLPNDPLGFNPFASSGPVSAMPSPAQHSPAVAAEIQGQANVRLGSPFVGRSSNTFPREAMSHSFEPPASFEQRFAAMRDDSHYLH